MPYIYDSPILGAVDLTVIDPEGPGLFNVISGVGKGRNNFAGKVISAYDPIYGGGEFIFLKGVASLAVGDVVSYNALTGVTTRWAGAANTGLPLAVAIIALTASQWGWFQISGNAVVTVSGTVAVGDAAFFNATASLKTAAVAGKQVLNCVASLANGGTPTGGTALASTQAVYTINRPFCQGQIT